MTKTKEYRSWYSMRNRCNNTNANCYNNYGGRGIKICSKWDDFIEFYKDMGDRPEGTSLDRIDNNGNYEPSNCRWADKFTQARNKRISRNNNSGHKGVSFCNTHNRWVSYININNKRKILGTYLMVEDAIEARINAERKYL